MNPNVIGTKLFNLKKKMTLTKGKSSSTSEFAKDSDELANSKPTIRMLKDKCGLSTGSTHTVVDETPSGQHWLLEDRKHFVYKNQENDHWKWVVRGVIPVGAGEKPAGGKRKLGTLKDSESEQLKQLELQTRATQLGTRMMVLERRNPTEYRNMLSRLAELEGTEAQDEAQEEEDRSVQQTTKNHGPADRCGAAARSSTAVEAGGVGASGATAAQVSQKEQGTQAYEAQRHTVWSRLGTAQADGGDGASRAAAAQASGSVRKDPCFVAAAQV